MTMNFGDATHPTKDMLAATKSALEASADQVAADLSEPGRHARRAPALGPPRRDADDRPERRRGRGVHGRRRERSRRLRHEQGLGPGVVLVVEPRSPCDGTFADVTVLSNTCSGVTQQPLEFANVFTSLTGRAPYRSPSDAVTVPDQQATADDPATSPYPIWRPDAEYPAGLQGRAGRPGVPGQVVHQGPGPVGHRGEPLGHAVDARRPGPPRRRAVHPHRRWLRGPIPTGTTMRCTPRATGCCTAACRTRPAGPTRARSRRRSSRSGRTPRGGRSSSCPASPRTPKRYGARSYRSRRFGRL